MTVKDGGAEKSDKNKAKKGLGVYARLFFSMLVISAFTFGGGFVIITFMKKKFVDKLGWLTEEEMLDYTALAQTAPGAIAVNAAILVGRKIGSFTGMLIAVTATVIPPIAIITLISFFYSAFAENATVAAVLGAMQAGVAAVLADVVCSLFAGVAKKKRAIDFVIAALSFAAVFFFEVNVVIIIAAAALTGAAYEPIRRRAAKKR